MEVQVSKLIEGFFHDGGRIRGVPVTIGGSSYKPPIPVETLVKESIQEILMSEKEAIDIAINLCMYSMKTQIFIDGNKRASVIFANHFLIAHGQGFLVIPEEHVPEFKKKLVAISIMLPLIANSLNSLSIFHFLLFCFQNGFTGKCISG